MSVTAVALSSLVLSACSNSEADGNSAGGAKSVSVRMDWTPLGYQSPFYVAQEKGYYKEAGLDVAIAEGAGSSTTAQVVGNGQDDFGLVDLSSTMPLISKGAKFKAIAVIAQSSPYVLVSKKDTGITKPSDLEGKVAGVSSGGSDQSLLPVFLSTAGVDKSKVKVNAFAASAKVASLAEDKVDAILGLTVAQVPVFEGMNIPINTIPVSDYVTLSSFSIIANQKMISDDPDTVKAFVTATLRGLEYAQKNPESAIDIMSKGLKAFDKKAALRQLEEALLLLHTQNTEGQPLGLAAGKDILATEDALGKSAGMKVTGDASLYFDGSFLK